MSCLLQSHPGAAREDHSFIAHAREIAHGQDWATENRDWKSIHAEGKEYGFSLGPAEKERVNWKMVFWTPSYGSEGHDSHASLFWQEPENDDLFGQFVDFDAETPVLSTGAFTSPDEGSIPTTIGAGSSTGSDDMEFLASQFHSTGASQTGQSLGNEMKEGAIYSLPRASISESDMPRLDDMTLHSPVKNRQRTVVSDPNSPTPPSTVRKMPGSTNKFMEKLSSTIRKATGRRGRTMEREDGEMERDVSPTAGMPVLKNRKTRAAAPPVIKTDQAQESYIPPAVNYAQVSPLQQQAASMSFAPPPVFLDDPFTEGSPTLQHDLAPRYFSANTTPLESPVGNNFFGQQHTDPIPQNDWGQQDAWPQQGWWDMNSASQHQNQTLAYSHPRNSSVGGPPGTGYQCASLEDPAAAGLMIQNQMPVTPMANQGPNNLGAALVIDGQTYLPPPVPASEPRARPRAPRAKSSGARHLSLSPQRKTPRQPSASPNRRTSRQSSGSSARSASGKLPSDMPGTPCSVKKRRSRDVSLGGGSAAGGASLGGGGISLDNSGFVNFTPSDGTVLMTGVAPSGSSKTKARREKEAMEKRRRMSEAAMRAVQAAGGDVDKFIEQGFTF